MKYPDSKHKIYGVWANMKERCDNKNYYCYHNYGGRGIKYDLRWKDFKAFCDDMLSGWQEGLTLDRENNDGNYEASNCRWVTQQIQGNNKRSNHYITYKGKTQSLADWAREMGLKHNTLWHRVAVYKWPIDKCFNSKLSQGQKTNNGRLYG